MLFSKYPLINLDEAKVSIQGQVPEGARYLEFAQGTTQKTSATSAKTYFKLGTAGRVFHVISLSACFYFSQ